MPLTLHVKAGLITAGQPACDRTINRPSLYNINIPQTHCIQTQRAAVSEKSPLLYFNVMVGAKATRNMTATANLAADYFYSLSFAILGQYSVLIWAAKKKIDLNLELPVMVRTVKVIWKTDLFGQAEQHHRSNLLDWSFEQRQHCD